MFGNDRTEIRRVFVEAWRRARAGEALAPLERLIVEVVRLHPEYHRLLDHPDEAIEGEYPAELGQTNPFLHMGMHIAIREQAAADRPPGIAPLYRRLAARAGDPHEAEHRLMECLGQALWEAQRAGTLPDEARYLACARGLLD
jgi:hypothetical protein